MRRRDARFVTRIVLTSLLALCGASTAAQPARRRPRVSPMKVERTDGSGGLALTEPRVEDVIGAVDEKETPRTHGPVTRILRFLFRVQAAPEEAGPLHARATLKGGKKEVTEFDAALGGVKPGDDIAIPAGYDVTRSLEGSFTLDLEVVSSSGATVHRSRYAFGLPRYHTTTGFSLSSSHVLLRDGFESPKLNSDVWRRSIRDPGRSKVSQKDGRLWIESTGPVAYNGVKSRSVETRDVELICRVGIDSPNSQHDAILHLCGTGKDSPDNWIELKLVDAGRNRGRVYLGVSTPANLRVGSRGPVRVNGSTAAGFPLKIVSDGSSHLARGYVETGGVWTPVGDAFEVPARVSRVELKVEGWKETERSSKVWFDDCRMYPRAASSYVTVKLARRPDGSPGVLAGGAWPPVAFDGENRKFHGNDISVALYEEDGTTKVAEARSSEPFDYVLVPLRDAPWRSYPVAAVIRLFVRGKQMGPDHVIPRSGLKGLYPGDVYVFYLE